MVACNTNGVVQPDVCNPLDTGRTTAAEAPYRQHESLPKSVLNSLNSLVSRSQEQNDVTAWLRSEKLNMRCTCCLLILTLWSAAAGCNNRMPMCIGSFSYTRSGLVSLSEIPIRRSPDVTRSDRLIGNCFYYINITNSTILKTAFTTINWFPIPCICWILLATSWDWFVPQMCF